MQRLDWNAAYGAALGREDDLIEALAMAGKHATHEGEVTIPATKADLWHDALAAAVLAGWLAPLEWGPGGELRTRLTVPEGV